MTELISSNNPNNKWGQSIVEVILKAWSYEKTYTIKVCGNCHGMDVFEQAISMIHDSLFENGEPLKIILTNPDGDTLECEDDEDRGELWIKDMIVSMRLLDYIQPTLNEVRKINGAAPIADGDKPYQPLGDKFGEPVQMTGNNQTNHMN